MTPKALRPMSPIFLSTEENRAVRHFRGEGLTADDYRVLFEARDAYLYDDSVKDREAFAKDLDSCVAAAVARDEFWAGVSLDVDAQITVSSEILRLVPALEALGIDTAPVLTAHDECLAEARKYLRALIAAEVIDALLRDQDIQTMQDLAGPS